MLSVKKQMEYLKDLGYYKGEIDGIKGPLYNMAVRDLQNDYFERTKDRDGIYGEDTDILLINVHRVEKYTKNFNANEFSCNCGIHCTGFPAKLSVNLLKNLQTVRDKHGSTTVTSGLRCEKYNNSLRGSAKNSKHLVGKAVDFYNRDCNTLKGRRKIMGEVKTMDSYNYTYCNVNGSHTNMGKAIHMDTVL